METHGNHPINVSLKPPSEKWKVFTCFYLESMAVLVFLVPGLRFEGLNQLGSGRSLLLVGMHLFSFQSCSLLSMMCEFLPIDSQIPSVLLPQIPIRGLLSPLFPHWRWTMTWCPHLRNFPSVNLVRFRYFIISHHMIHTFQFFLPKCHSHGDKYPISHIPSYLIITS